MASRQCTDVLGNEQSFRMVWGAGMSVFELARGARIGEAAARRDQRRRPPVSTRDQHAWPSWRIMLATSRASRSATGRRFGISCHASQAEAWWRRRIRAADFGRPRRRFAVRGRHADFRAALREDGAAAASSASSDGERLRGSRVEERHLVSRGAGSSAHSASWPSGGDHSFLGSRSIRSAFYRPQLTPVSSSASLSVRNGIGL